MEKTQIFMIKKSTKLIFIKHKKVLNICHVNVSKILISKSEPYREKTSFIIGFNDDNDDVIKPLCIKLHKINK